jgi:hypothetical protein
MSYIVILMSFQTIYSIMLTIVGVNTTAGAGPKL